MKFNAIILFLILFPAFALAQIRSEDVYPPSNTSPPFLGRFELIQNSRAMRETYMLDKFTGQFWQLVQSIKGPRSVWQKIPRESQEKDMKPEGWTGPLYQVSISGLAAKGTYLVNTATGATWILYEDPKEGKFWGAIPPPE